MQSAATQPAATHPPTQLSPPGSSGAATEADPGLAVTAPPRPSPPQTWSARSLGDAQRVVRYGPGVPAQAPGGGAGATGAAVMVGAAGAAGAIEAVGAFAPAGPTGPAAGTAPTAEEVWRHGLPGAGPGRPRPLRRLAGTGLTVVLLVASAVVIFLRLHHPAFGVTGAAITQVTGGCTVDVTGRISATGGAGVVSYEWMFQPQLIAPQPMEQTVAAGQTAVYVSATIEGRQHGRLAQTVTLRVLSPGQPREATAQAVVSC